MLRSGPVVAVQVSRLREVVKAFARRALRWYGMHAPDKGKYRLVNLMASRLAPAKDVLVQVHAPHGFRMQLDLTEHLQQRAYYLGYHEHMIVRQFVQRILPGTTVFDLGANFGQFALLAAQLIGPSGQVFAFEPNPLCFAALRRNVELNRFANVTCRQSAVSDMTGQATFYLAPSTDLGTSSLARSAVEQYHRDVQAVPVDVERLDDYLDQVTRPVSLIKLDIQGAELLALRGAKCLIQRDHPTLILEADEQVTVAFQYTPVDLGVCLHDLGYTFYAVPVRPWQQPTRLDWRNLHSHDLLCLYEPAQTDT